MTKKPCKCKSPRYEDTDLCLSCGGFRYIQTDDPALQAIWDEIEDKADTYARNNSGYILDGDELGAENNPKKHIYDRLKRSFKAGANPIGERLAAAEGLIEKMKGALEATINMKVPMTEQQFRQYVAFAEANAREGMRDYQTYKISKDDSANG
jgi:hypothetical protein